MLYFYIYYYFLNRYSNSVHLCKEFMRNLLNVHQVILKFCMQKVPWEQLAQSTYEDYYGKLCKMVENMFFLDSKHGGIGGMLPPKIYFFY